MTSRFKFGLQNMFWAVIWLSIAGGTWVEGSDLFIDNPVRWPASWHYHLYPSMLFLAICFLFFGSLILAIKSLGTRNGIGAVICATTAILFLIGLAIFAAFMPRAHY